MLISLDGNGPKSHDKLTSLAAHAEADRIFPFFRLLMTHQNLTSGAEEKTGLDYLNPTTKVGFLK